METPTLDTADTPASPTTEKPLKSKRRTRNDLSDRDYKCGCGKMYLSYPALYTHVKQKHEGCAPDGTTAPCSRLGKTRGRPKRNALKPTETGVSDEDEFYEKHDFAGGPADPLEACVDTCDLKDFVARLDTDTLGPDSPCKDVLAAYLLDVAAKVKQDSLKQFAEFLDALAACLNLKGYALPGENRERENCESFCSVRPAKHIPDLANYFITDFLEGRRNAPDRPRAVDMMLHLCRWLNGQHFTNLRLSLIDQGSA